MYSINPYTATEPDGTCWVLQKAIVQALRRRGLDAHVEPFDQYQGPYICVGPDLRVGTRQYQLAVQHLGIIRLWVTDSEGRARIWNEATDKISKPFWPFGNGAGRTAVKAALSVLS